MPRVGLPLLLLVEGVPHFSRLLFKELNQFEVILLVLEAQQFVLLLVFGVVDLCFYGLELADQVLEAVVGILHLLLLQGYALLELDDSVVGLSQGVLIELEVVVRHLALLLNVLVLQLLKVGANLTEIVNYGQHLSLGRIELILELTDGLSGPLLTLIFGFCMQFAGSSFYISNACNRRFIDLCDSLLF
jgi:hypothetical protein